MFNPEVIIVLISLEYFLLRISQGVGGIEEGGLVQEGGEDGALGSGAKLVGI